MKGINFAEIQKGKAKKYNHYQKGDKVEGHSCETCLRRQFSHPWTCQDGWNEDRGSTCLNWTDNPTGPVD